jgi:hypothetical protein
VSRDAVVELPPPVATDIAWNEKQFMEIPTAALKTFTKEYLVYRPDFSCPVTAARSHSLFCFSTSYIQFGV